MIGAVGRQCFVTRKMTFVSVEEMVVKPCVRCTRMRVCRWIRVGRGVFAVEMAEKVETRNRTSATGGGFHVLCTRMLHVLFI